MISWHCFSHQQEKAHWGKEHRVIRLLKESWKKDKNSHSTAPNMSAPLYTSVFSVTAGIKLITFDCVVFSVVSERCIFPKGCPVRNNNQMKVIVLPCTSALFYFQLRQLSKEDTYRQVCLSASFYACSYLYEQSFLHRGRDLRPHTHTHTLNFISDSQD